jgi:hypothetical protein
VNKGFRPRPYVEPFDLTYRQRARCTEMALTLNRTFVWSESPEGYRYWDDVYERLRAHGLRIH